MPERRCTVFTTSEPRSQLDFMKNPVLLFLALLLHCVSLPLAIGAEKSANCRVSPTVQAMAPREPGVDPLSGAWHINADQSMWALHQRWQAGVANKEPWIRPAGIHLVVTGRFLNGEAPPLKVSVAGTYGTRFQATGMEFPIAGCWEVTGKAGDKALRFVTEVEPSPAKP